MFGVAFMMSVVATLEADTVTAAAHVPDEIVLVPMAAVPDATSTVQVAQAIVPVAVMVPPVIGDVVVTLVTVPGVSHVNAEMFPEGVPHT